MSKTPAEKLGFRPGMRVRLVGAPSGLELALPESREGPYDLQLIFVRDAAGIAAAASEAERLYPDGARLWFAYPKKTGAIATDISRDKGWEPVAALGLLGVTQIAIDQTWSAVRFRRRNEITRMTRKFGSRPGIAPVQD